ncbi:MAG: response regulator [Phycisphaerae bacterium]|nr:response regulator [Phycisphaerae bacterium]
MIEAALKPKPGDMLQKSMRILLIEDNLGDQRLIEEILNESSGQSDLHWASTLEDGIEAVKKDDYDLILLDLNLPDSDGIKTFQRIYDAAPMMPIVVLTGTDDEKVGTKALALGAQDYLIKGRVDSYSLGKSVRFAVERRLAAEKIERYQAKVARSELFASLGTISAAMVHELSQPVTVINLGIENVVHILKESQCHPEAVSQLEDSLRSVHQVNEIINKFRKFGRNTLEKRVDEVNFQDAADKIIKFLNPSMRQARMEVTAELSDMPPVRCGRDDIEQMFLMLIQNSIQAVGGKKGCKLVISGTFDGTDVDLLFSDNCGGISMEDQKKIFQPFFTTKLVSGGTGLGLSIVQQIVSKYDGSIRVSSTDGHGTNFFVTLSVDAEGGGKNE